LQGTMHGSMAARGVGGTTDRNNLSARQANGAEVDAAVQEEVQKMSERGVRLLKGIAEGTYNTKHAEAAKPTILEIHIHRHRMHTLYGGTGTQ